MTDTLCNSPPTAAEIVTAYTPKDPVHETVEVPEVTELVRETLPLLKVQARPEEGETETERLTVPVNPLTSSTVTTVAAVEPA